MYKHRPTAISHLRQTDLHFQVALTVIIFKYLTWIRMMKGPLWTEPQSNWLGLDLLNNLAYCPTEETHVLFIWPQKTQSTEGETCHKMNLTEKHPCPLSETRRTLKCSDSVCGAHSPCCFSVLLASGSMVHSQGDEHPHQHTHILK